MDHLGDARSVTDRLAARSLLTAIVASPAMIVASSILTWLLRADVAVERLLVWLACLTGLQSAMAIVAFVGVRTPRWRMRSVNVVTALAAIVMSSVAALQLIAPPAAGRTDIALMYQLWICGTAASMTLIANSLTRLFLAGPATMVTVNGIALLAGATVLPRSVGALSVLYLAVLAVCHVVQRQAMRDAVSSEQRSQRLLVELEMANDALTHEATHDVLTGIANRRRIIAELDASLRRIGDGGSEVAVLFLDLDGFKEINDTFGHAVGDELLGAVAVRIGALLGSDDIVGRQGGDEFIVLVRSRALYAARELAERIRATIETSFRVGEHILAVSVSVGLVWCDRGGLQPDDVLRDADVALYRAKECGRNCVIEHCSEVERGERRSRTVADLRTALQEQRIVPYYQPVVDMETGAIVGAEALARWPQPDGTILLPAEFLQALTEAGLDTDLGIHMALQIMHARSEIAVFVPETFRIALNVTFRRSRAKDVVEALASMRDVTTPTGASVLQGMTIELTENAAMRDIDETRAALERARQLGIAVALDDFGTGHSSLTLVRQLPLDVIKIDRCFVHGLARDPANQAVVAAIVELANGVGATVVGEGVEATDDALELREIGCRLAQGFVYAPAVPLETLQEWLQHGPPWQQPVVAEAVAGPAASRVRLDVRPR